MESPPVDAPLVVRDLWFRYPSSDWVLRGVSLSVGRGEVVLVLGASGSGKTTLLRSLTGVGVWVYGGEMRGEVVVSGRRVRDLALDELRRALQVVNQNAYTHFLEHRVGLDLYYISTAIHGAERGGRVFKRVVSTFKLEGLLGRRFFELSGGQLRRAAIAKAMVWDPEVVILDEPLMWLDDEGLEELREVLITLRSMGKALLVLEHRFLGLLDLASRVFVLRSGTLSPLEHGELRHPRKLALPSRSERSSAESPGGGEPVLRAEDVWFRYERDSAWLLRGASLSVESRGDTVVVFGQNGSGKSTLLKLLSGYLVPERGRVERAPGVRAVYLPQNVYLFFTEESLRRELEVVCSRRAGGGCLERGLRTLKSLGADLDAEASPFNLSWGQAVRAALSIAMSVEDEVVLLLDEPFTGLTYADRLSLARLLADVKVPKILTVSNKETLSMLSSLPSVRVYELREGLLSAIRPGVDPEVVSAAERCRELGIYGVA